VTAATLLETERLRLEPFAECHLTHRYVGWLNDPQVVRFSEQRHHHHTIESCRAYLQSFSESRNYFWAIVVRDGGDHVGNITAVMDVANGLGDVAVLIGDRRHWGEGIATEAWIRVCSFLIDEVGVRKVTAGTVAANEAMIAIMHRAGMREDGRRRRHHLIEGAEIDLVYMALFRESD
jgi:ribosomal-protein-alanine N-acetyltransferase